MLNLTEINRI